MRILPIEDEPPAAPRLLCKPFEDARLRTHPDRFPRDRNLIA